MMDQNALDPQFDAKTARLLRREALRRETETQTTTSGPGLEAILARISDEVTIQAAMAMESIIPPCQCAAVGTPPRERAGLKPAFDGGET
jgi:hypothetical protein